MDNYDHSVCGELRINVHEIYVIFLFIYTSGSIPALKNMVCALMCFIYFKCRVPRRDTTVSSANTAFKIKLNLSL
jgi:hypothetical protein